MVTHITARHFKADQSLLSYAESAVEELVRFHDGIIRAEVILSYEKTRNDTKTAEVVVSVYNAKLAGIQRADDFQKSLDGAVRKVLVQLKRYKEKLHAKDRKAVRRVKDKV